MLPCLSILDKGQSLMADPISPCNGPKGFTAAYVGGDLHYIGGSEFGGLYGVRYPTMGSPVCFSVFGVLFSGSPSQVVRPVVCPVAIQVPALHPGGFGANKRFKDNPVDGPVVSLSVSIQSNGWVVGGLIGSKCDPTVRGGSPLAAGVFPATPNRSIRTSAVSGKVRNVSVFDCGILVAHGLPLRRADRACPRRTNSRGQLHNHTHKCALAGAEVVR